MYFIQNFPFSFSFNMHYRVLILGDSVPAHYHQRKDITSLFSDAAHDTFSVTHVLISGGTLSTFLNNGRVQRALQQNPHYVILMFTGNDIDTIYRLHGFVPWQPHPECWDMSCHLDRVLGRVGVECSCPRQRHITKYASPS